MKHLAVFTWLGFLFIAIATLFWYNEYRYQLPTPLPENYHVVSNGSVIQVPKSLKTSGNKPVFLHFFNPDCPCSRFNMPHVASLIKQYGKDVEFTVVVVNNERYSARQIQERFGISVPVSFDTALASLCGVYSTPQAVILDKDRQLYYRGNYNKNRYCTDKKTNYAQIALDDLIAQRQTGFFDKFALTAYGCELPQCTKK
jgi:thiol-disulfide isomerase/thioredoxin